MVTEGIHRPEKRRERLAASNKEKHQSKGESEATLNHCVGPPPHNASPTQRRTSPPRRSPSLAAPPPPCHQPPPPDHPSALTRLRASVPPSAIIREREGRALQLSPLAGSPRRHRAPDLLRATTASCAIASPHRLPPSLRAAAGHGPQERRESPRALPLAGSLVPNQRRRTAMPARPIVASPRRHPRCQSPSLDFPTSPKHSPSPNRTSLPPAIVREREGRALELFPLAGSLCRPAPPLCRPSPSLRVATSPNLRASPPQCLVAAGHSPRERRESPRALPSRWISVSL